jgi:hypothetical protein
LQQASRASSLPWGVDLVRRRWQQPKLRLLPFRADKGDGSYLDILDGRQDAWLRLGILNEGRQAARDIEVHIEDITLEESTPMRSVSRVSRSSTSRE